MATIKEMKEKIMACGEISEEMINNLSVDEFISAYHSVLEAEVCFNRVSELFGANIFPDEDCGAEFFDTMTMTKKLANQLLETLMCMAISATGGIDLENIDQKQMECAENYAKETFCDLLGAWEEFTGKKWDIEEESDENEMQ